MSSLTPTKSLHPVQACLTTVAAVLIIVMLATPTHALNANVVVFTCLLYTSPSPRD